MTPAFPIRLVALDLDGTLVDDDLLLRERTRAAIGAAIDRGVSVSIVTGRMATSAMVFARELGVRDPLVGFQGALIRAIPEPGSERLGRLLRHRPRRPLPARRSSGAARSGSIRTSTTSSGSSSGPTTREPRTIRRSSAAGRSSSRTSSRGCAARCRR